MKKFLALALCLVMAFAFCACAGKEGKSDASELKVGIILVGDESEGYTLAHMEGFKAAMKELGISDSQVTWKYKIPETSVCYDTATELAEKGCDIIFSNSYGHQAFMVEAAKDFPDKVFVAVTGDTANVCGLDNVVNMFPHTYESRYVSGVVAGMKLKELMDAGAVTDPHIGYVGAYPYAEVVSGYTAFFLGIQSIVPEAYMDVYYTHEWFDLVKEGQAADTLMSMGCVIIGQHADSTGAPAAVQAALNKSNTAYSVGYNIDMRNVAPDAALTSSQNNWSVLYINVLKDYMENGKCAHDYTAGYEADAVMISELGNSCAAGTAEKVKEVIDGIKAGTLHVFDASTFKVAGANLETSTFDFSTMNADYSAVEYQGATEECIKTDANGVKYFEESYFRSAPYFALRIDGINEINPDN